MALHCSDSDNKNTTDDDNDRHNAPTRNTSKGKKPHDVMSDLGSSNTQILQMMQLTEFGQGAMDWFLDAQESIPHQNTQRTALSEKD